jgi:DNA sulfur modification protein DndC
MYASAYAELTLWETIISDIKAEYLSNVQNYPWIIGFSGGKDSTLVAHAALEAILSIPPSQRIRHIHVVSNDTLVESPLVIAHLSKVQRQIEEAATTLGLPITVATTHPALDQSFWTLLIGKGYPSPNQTMRWCTDRLKIQPTSRYILDNVSQHGAAIVVLGVRKDESNSRLKSIDKHQNLQGSNLAPHSALPGAFIYRPIADLSLDDVWEILGQYTPPWGGTHKNLIQLYRDAEGGECPVVLSKEEAPGCGTNSSRFGCWTCTVVEKDKSLQGFIDVGNHHFKALVEFRDWIKSIRNEPQHRQVERRNGRVQFDLSGRHIPGPFTMKTRQLILNRLLKIEKEFGEKLISNEELDLIQSIWANELSQKGAQ